eukprot:gb/GEZN01001648.1/.p1 GENE.gb/GEZN01001648.1/~~gb/GEZN01001648.1/.p1  ORF type:complete len:257 (+),score=44.94 gb/GEZN01001648.1/:1291-2061(+)
MIGPVDQISADFCPDSRGVMVAIRPSDIFPAVTMLRAKHPAPSIQLSVATVCVQRVCETAAVATLIIQTFVSEFLSIYLDDSSDAIPSLEDDDDTSISDLDVDDDDWTIPDFRVSCSLSSSSAVNQGAESDDNSIAAMSISGVARGEFSSSLRSFRSRPSQSSPLGRSRSSSLLSSSDAVYACEVVAWRVLPCSPLPSIVVFVAVLPRVGVGGLGFLFSLPRVGVGDDVGGFLSSRFVSSRWRSDSVSVGDFGVSS